MAMLRICSADGCEIKTLGHYCINHETVSRIVKRPAATAATAIRAKAAA